MTNPAYTPTRDSQINVLLRRLNAVERRLCCANAGVNPHPTVQRNLETTSNDMRAAGFIQLGAPWHK
jgi:hypothetical protein